MLTQLVLPTAVALAVMQVGLLLLARGLGRLLRREAVLAGLLLPWVLLAPWVTKERLLVPSNVLVGALPGTEASQVSRRHGNLNDAIYQLLPWEVEVRRALSARRLPLWSDLLDGGSSPWANPQSQVLSPVAMLARAAPLQHHLFVCLALKVMVALQGAWVLCRMLGAGRRGALLGAASFAIGGGVLGWWIFPLSTAVAWAPWVTAGVVRMGRRPGRGAFLALAVATAALALAGHPETALGAVLVAAGLGFALRHRRRVPLRRFLAGAGAAGLLGAALAAPLLVPFTAAAERSVRARERLGAVMPAGEAFIGQGHRYFLGPFGARVFGKPYGPTFTGPWGWPESLSAYTGMLALAGAAASLAGRTRRRTAPLLAISGVVLLVASRPLPLELLLWRVPPLRVPELSRFVPLACLGIAAAGALGWTALERRRRPLAAALVPGVAMAPDAAVLLPALLLVAAGALLWGRRATAAAVVAALALLGDLVPWGRAQLPKGDPFAFYRTSPLMEQVKAEAATGPFRAAGEDFLIYPSVLPVFGVADPRFHNPLAPVEQRAVLGTVFGFAPDSSLYFAPLRNVEHPLLDFLGVRMLVSNEYQPAKRRLEFAGGGEQGFRVYRNPAALPRWFLATEAEVAPAARALERIAAIRDARSVVLIAERSGGWRPASQRWDPGAVRPTEPPRPGRLSLAVAGEGERLLATSLPGPFGWSARSGGGGELRTLPVNGAYLGVAVPAEVERLELRYRPPGIVAGTVVATLAMVALGAAAVRPAGNRRRLRRLR